MKRQQAGHLSHMRKQRGFLLWQMAIAVTMLSIVMAYAGQRYAKTVIQQSRDDRARLVGARMASVNDATKTYTTTFFAEIQQGQSVTRNGYTVPGARVLAPTMADLNGLGFLASKSVNPVVYNGQSIGFTVLITVDTSSGCAVPACNLPFQVTSTNPLIDPSTNQVDIRRATIAAATASPGNAGVAMPASFGGNPNIFVTQNGTQTGKNPGGVAGLVSMSNGYDSQGFAAFLRRDGTLPMTGNLNLQDTTGLKHDVNNANNVNAVTLNASGNANVGGETYTGGWFRTLGDSGWYSQKWGGGWYMSDPTWIRAYGSKNVWTPGTLQADTNVNSAYVSAWGWMNSAGRLRTGEYLQIDGWASSGYGCSQNGLIGRDGNGVPYACQNGVWKSMSGTVTTVTSGGWAGWYWNGSEFHSDASVSCPAGGQLVSTSGWCDGTSYTRLWQVGNGTARCASDQSGGAGAFAWGTCLN